MKAQILASVLVAVAGVTIAETQLDVGRIKKRKVVSDGVRMVATCPASSSAYPEGKTPIFHFDASSRTGWEMSGNMVTKIPSASNDRFLTTNGDDIVSWKGWTKKGGPNLPQGAELVLNEEMVGIQGPYLDFGSLGSARGLVFDVDPAKGSNGVFNVRTIVAVMDTSRGGGMLLGGGYGFKVNGTTSIDGYTFVRNGTGAIATDRAYAKYLSAYTGTCLGQWGFLLHDAIWVGAPIMTAYNGAWEVVVWATDDEAQTVSGTGVGIGRIDNQASPNNSGAQCFAEMMVFENLLTEKEMERVSAYLRNKWFGDPVPGYDGAAEAGVLRLSHRGVDGSQGGNVTSKPPSAIAEVNENETLTVDRFAGGRIGGTVSKVGAGTLAVRASDTYGGTIAVKEGTLAFPRRTVPAALPTRGVVWHLAADDAESLTTRKVGDVTYVSDWTDRENGFFAAKAPNEASQPVLRYGDFANGKPCIDFGKLNSGCIFNVVNASGTAATIPTAVSVVYVLGAQEGGGSIFGSVDASFAGGYAYLDRGTVQTTFNANLWWGTGANQLCYLRGNLMYMGAYFFNGEMDAYLDESANVNFGYVTSGWQTFGVNLPLGKILTLGGTRWVKGPCTGGLRLAELAVYDRHLTEDELRDASAYLSWKWFGRVSAGYERPDGKVSTTAAKVSVGANVTLRVDSGAARIDELSTNVTEAVVTKAGAGRLEIQSAQGGTLSIADGCVRAVAPTDVGTETTVAERSSLWLDAADAKTLVTVSADDVDRVKVWGDTCDPRAAAYANESARRPFINTTDLQNGHPMIDFGEHGPDGATMNFARPLDNIRSVYMVVKFAPGSQAPLLGWSTDDKVFTASHRSSPDFTRRRKLDEDNPRLLSTTLTGYSAASLYGTFLTNGVSTTATFKPTEDCQLIEIHMTRGAYASAIGYEGAAEWDGASNKSFAEKLRGGLRVGELIVYERALTDREKIATRNYLMKKWFAKTDDELTPLPEATPSTLAFDAVNVAPGGAFETSAGTTLGGDLAYADGATLNVNLKADGKGGVTADVLHVAGEVSFGSSLNVTVASEVNLDAIASVKVPLIEAGSFAGAENLKAAVLPPAYAGRYRLAVRGNSVVFTRINGLTVIVR